jgi:hypothetical protein
MNATHPLLKLSFMLGAVAFILTACKPAAVVKKSEAHPKADPTLTWEYWKAMHQRPANSNDFQVLGEVNWQNADQASEKYAVTIFQSLATAENSWCERISSLGVLHVDPDLTEYAVRFVAFHREVGGFMSDVAQVLETGTGLPDAPDAALEFVISLLKHANDGDNLFWNAVKEQVAKTATDVGDAQSRAQELTDRMKKVADHSSALDTEELSLRIKLARRYNREFPAGATYPPGTNPAASLSDAQRPAPREKNDLMRDLIGRQRLTGPPPKIWTFDSLQEYRSFVIDSMTDSGDVLKYEVSTHVKGRFSGEEHDFKLRLRYRLQNGAWRLVVVEAI